MNRRVYKQITAYKDKTLLRVILGIIFVFIVTTFSRRAIIIPLGLANSKLEHFILISLAVIPLIISLSYDFEKRKKTEVEFEETRKQMSEELLKKDDLLQALAEATYCLLKTPEPAKAFCGAFKILGETTGVDGIYIYQQKFNKELGQNFAIKRYEWSKRKSEFDQNFLEPTTNESNIFGRWIDEFIKGNFVSGLLEDFPEDERQILSVYGVVSLLAVPIFIDEILWGFIGFYDCTKPRKWHEAEKSILMLAAGSFGGAFKRLRQEEILQEVLKEDFRQTVHNLQNVIFKVIKNSNGAQVFTLFEGKIAHEHGLSTEFVSGKTTHEIFISETANIMSHYLEQAFFGEVVSFELNMGRKVYYVTLSPIVDGTVVTEVVGSAIDISERKEAEEKVKYLAHYDSLTGLPNRYWFTKQLERALAQAKEHKQTLAVMFVDLDRFKIINDTLGHAFGDLLLRSVAERLMKCVREGDLVARLGGDEFTLLFPIKSHANTTRIAEKILQRFSSPFVIDGQELFITPSIGVSIYPIDGTDVVNLIKNADTAMYRAKEKGRNNYQLYTMSMNYKAGERLRLEIDLRKAIEREEFEVYYQPLVEVKSKRIVGSEALIRWKHPVLGVIPPAEFIPIAEETGMIVQIGEWVLRRACAQNQVWLAEGRGPMRIAVNLSARQFEHQGLAQKVSDILKETGMDPSLLELEITENIMMKNTEHIVGAILKLKSMGVHFSVDDFGTGFSSLSYLKQFAVDILKIDRSFIKDITLNPNNAEITKGIIMLAHGLNIEVIAEGVETEEQLQFLQLHGCNVMQGYLVSPPVSSQEFEKILANLSSKKGQVITLRERRNA